MDKNVDIFIFVDEPYARLDHVSSLFEVGMEEILNRVPSVCIEYFSTFNRNLYNYNHDEYISVKFINLFGVYVVYDISKIDRKREIFDRFMLKINCVKQSTFYHIKTEEVYLAILKRMNVMVTGLQHWFNSSSLMVDTPPQSRTIYNTLPVPQLAAMQITKSNAKLGSIVILKSPTSNPNVNRHIIVHGQKSTIKAALNKHKTSILIFQVDDIPKVNLLSILDYRLKQFGGVRWSKNQFNVPQNVDVSSILTTILEELL